MEEACLKTFDDGFSLLEVVVAMAVAVVLVFAVSATLTTVLRGEETAEWLRQGALHIRTIQARFYLEGGDGGLESGAYEPWAVRFEDVAVPAGEDSEAWRVWELAPDARSGLLVPMALRVLP